jgi:hypothetical protein
LQYFKRAVTLFWWKVRHKAITIQKQHGKRTNYSAWRLRTDCLMDSNRRLMSRGQSGRQLWNRIYWT